MTPETLTLDRTETPLGELLVVVDRQGAVCALEFADREERMRRLMARHHPGAILVEGGMPAPARTAITAYFAGDVAALDGLATRTGGTDFQHRVWQALRAIPAGATLSYGELAGRLGQPRAVRAVGGANRLNPIGIAVPCHRVIASSGGLGGYAGGVERKAWLLDHEKRASGRATATVRSA